MIIPIFNVVKGGFFNDLLESIKRQGELPVEYVFADDASTDEFLKYCIDFAKDRSDVTVLHLLENRQRGGALNRCIKESTGEYIALLDSDDYISDEYLEFFAKSLNSMTSLMLLFRNIYTLSMESRNLFILLQKTSFLKSLKG